MTPFLRNSAELRRALKTQRLVLFGETHGFCRDIVLQGRIIKWWRPDWYLHEWLENKEYRTRRAVRTLLPHPDTEPFSVISVYGELKPLARLALRQHLKMGGIDLADGGRSIPPKAPRNAQERRYEHKLLLKRERHQARCISRRTASGKRILAVVGAYHLRKESALLKALRNVPHILVYPTWRGRPIYGPHNSLKPNQVIFDWRAAT